MMRTRIGLAVSAAALTVLGALGTPTVAGAQPTPGVPGGGVATTEPSPAPSGGANGYEHHGILRNMLHGEGVVQTKNGTERVALQKGTITSVTTSQIGVKSSDGWSKTWTLGNNVRVYENQATVQPSALTTGSLITVAGTITGTGANGTTYTAQMVRVHSGPSAQPAPSGTPAPSGAPAPAETPSAGGTPS
ncbi:hypothetical protein [Dactylosporangium sp. NPDC005555]|uniref:hypothetical protein n=1 Tax=Dactylosporangium sp. NPDC005555 TaxID=3154889 RepID=UPI0033A43694